MAKTESQPEMPAPRYTHWVYTSCPSWPGCCSPHTPLPRKEQFMTCCSRSHADTPSPHLPWSKLTKNGIRRPSRYPHHVLHLPAEAAQSVSSQQLQAQRRPCPFTNEQDGPRLRRAKVNDCVSRALSFPSPVRPSLESKSACHKEARMFIGRTRR